MRILMVAAENGALPGGKVGGMGDVLRDIPPALADLGHEVDVILPGYGKFSVLPGATQQAMIPVRFRGQLERVALYRLQLPSSPDGVTHWLLDHPLLAPQAPGQIYCDDPPSQPFATDASKFALFAAAVVQALTTDHLPRPEVIHLHDWHTALVAVLARYHPASARLAGLPLVYTIHNLALQGIRPLRGDVSSLESWFPGLDYVTAQVNDRRYPHCFNPVRAAITLCDRIHAVSPSYAREILSPAAGAGLEQDLQAAQDAERLHGILNGCEYPAEIEPALPFTRFVDAARAQVARWIGRGASVSAADLLALRKLDQWQGDRPEVLVTSVGRITDQKVSLLGQPMPDGRPVLEHLLDALPERGLLVILGSGDPHWEGLLTSVTSHRDNLWFLRGYSDALSTQLYAGGDLFLMPSSFEPCGISQMLAMRSGQPCLVHEVGGLADTVEDGVNGFGFRGADPMAQATALLQRLQQVLKLMRNPPEWQRICDQAAAARFQWRDSAQQYVDLLYRA